MGSGDVAFVSSGDPEKDAITAEGIRTRSARTAEGMCPNGCGPLAWGDDPNVATCPACNFIGVQAWGRGDFTRPGAALDGEA